MIEEGQMAPDVVLQLPDESETQLSAYRGQPLVLYFYPKDDTPGCTKEAIQAGIREIVYAGANTYEDELEQAYQKLIAEASLFFRQLR